MLLYTEIRLQFYLDRQISLVKIIKHSMNCINIEMPQSPPPRQMFKRLDPPAKRS